VKPTASQTDYIERVGRWWELVGSRSAGRILGWLMICEPPHRSSTELQSDLQLSAGSVSAQTNALERVGFVERITFPADRASYYQLRPHVWVELMRSEQDRLQELLQLARAAGDVLPSDRPDRVTDLARVSDFFLAEWPDLMDRLSEHLEKEKTG
jgi:DNA-binding transcriptional regulator GbsR (MarR family)